MRIDLTLLCAFCLSVGTLSVEAQDTTSSAAGAEGATAAQVTVGASAGTSTAPEVTTAAAAAGPAEAPEQPPSSMPWALVHRRYNTRDGSSGGLFVGDASSGAPGSLRLQLFLDTFSGGDVLYEGDEISQNGQTLSLGWTALEFLELFASLRNRDTSSETPTVESIHTLGDIGFGFKAFGAVSPIWHLGGGASLLVQSGVGAGDTLLGATNISLTGNATLDLRGAEDPFPLIGRFELGYTFDNSAKVVDDIEDARYEDLAAPRPRADEVRNLVTRFERYGLGTSRVDRFSFGLGFEMPFAAATDFHLHPLLEWRWAIPVGRQGYDCAFYSSDADAGSIDGADDSCLGEEGVSAWPMNLAVGLRIVPPVRGVSFALAGDFGLTGTSTFVRELAPNSPFTIIAALSYDYDARPPPPPPPPPAPVATTGTLRGVVVDASSDAPLENARVRFLGRDLDAHLTDSAGRFTSPPLEAGEVLIEAQRDAYAPGQCVGTIPPEGGQVDVRCALTAMPTVSRIEGRVVDFFGGPIAGARVSLTGAARAEARTEIDGDFVHADLAAGAYNVLVEADGHLARGMRVRVGADEIRTLEIMLVPRSESPRIEVRGDDIRVAGLTFEPGSSELTGSATLAVAELADLLLRDEGVRRIRVRGDGGAATALGRAVAIKAALITAGVGEFRIDVSSDPAQRVTITVLGD